MIKKIRFYFVLAFQLFVVSILQPVDLQDLKGTYTILKPEYQHLSPTHGAIWWETGLARKYYEFGNYEEIKEEKESRSVTKIEGDATMKLIHRLFHIVGGSFGITDSPYNPEYYFTPKIVGKIMGLIESVDHKNLASVIKNVIGKDKDFNQLVDDKDEELKSAGKVLINKQQLLAYFNGDFVPALVSSLQECGSDAKALYPSNTTQAILLAFLHRKANSKQDLQIYFEALQKQMIEQEKIKQKQAVARKKQGSEEQKSEQKVEAAPAFDTIFKEEVLWNEWAKDVYEQKKEVVKGILAKVKVLDFEDKEISKKLLEPVFYEQMVFAELMKLYMGELPNIAEYRTISLAESFGLPRVVTFPDCMDTTMRNMSNIICYDAQNKVFTLKKDGFKISVACQKFYENYQDPAVIADSKVHTAWTEVVQNIPYALYVNAVSKDGKTVLPKGGTNFVYVYGEGLGQVKEEKVEFGEEKKQVGQEEEKYFRELKIHGRTYRIVDPKKFVCYELKASVRNVIITLNHIFGLGLFDGKNIAEEFAKKDFNKIYLPIVCQKVGWACEGVDLGRIDENDYRRELNIKILLSGTSSSFVITILPGHGYVPKPPKPDRNVAMEEYLLNQCCIGNSDFRTLALSALYSSNDFSESEFKSRLFMNHYFFLQDLLEVNRRLDVFKFALQVENYQLAARMILSFPFNQDLYYQNTILESVNDRIINDQFIKRVLQKMVDRIEKDFMPSKLIKELKFLHRCFLLDLCTSEKAIKIAQKGIKGSNFIVIENAQILFTALVEKGQGFVEAIVVAQEGMKSYDLRLRGPAQKLFNVLFEKGQGFVEALQVAQEGMKSYDNGIRNSSIELFEALFDKGQGIKEALQVAQEGLKSDDEDIRASAEQLKARLQDKGEWKEAQQEASVASE